MYYFFAKVRNCFTLIIHSQINKKDNYKTFFICPFNYEKYF